LEAFVAVAVIVWPTLTTLDGVNVKLALPLASVVTLFWPMTFLPSSVPEGLEKMVRLLGFLGYRLE
jgi:hypothetical protein